MNTDPKKKVFAPEDSSQWPTTENSLLTVLGVPFRFLPSPHIPLCPQPQQLTNSPMMRPSSMTFRSRKKIVISYNSDDSTRSGSKHLSPPKPQTFSADRARIPEGVTKSSTLLQLQSRPSIFALGDITDLQEAKHCEKTAGHASVVVSTCSAFWKEKN